MTSLDNNSNINEEPEKSVEAKLGDLMMKGWTMLADCCFKESCKTPLMRDNVSKQVYCVGCEAWVCNKERKSEQQKFTELVSLEGKRVIQLKNNNEVSTLSSIKKTVVSSSDAYCFREILEKKLIDLSKWLESESDAIKCNQILDAIRKTYDLLNDLSARVKGNSTQVSNNH